MSLLTPILVALLPLSFVLGAIAGYYVLGTNGAKKKVRISIALLVTIVWVISVLAAIVMSGYMVPLMVHTIMGVVVGYFFAKEEVREAISARK